ncbi:MAG: hypothetical protein WC854_13390, partial [Bacteroidales bacterium]
SEGVQTLVGNATSTSRIFVTATGVFTQSSGTFNMATSTGDTLNLGRLTFYNLNITGTTTLSNDTVTTTNVLTNSGVLIAGSSTIVLPGTGTPFVNNGTFTSNTSTVVYSGSTSNIASTTYYNLTLNGATSADITGSTTVQNTLSITNGMLEEPGSDYLTLSGSGTPLSNSSAAFLATSTNRVNVSFSGSSVNIPSAVYYTLLINSASSSLIGNVTSSNALVINSGKTLNAGSYTIVFSANSGNVFQDSGTFNAGTSNVFYAGTGAVTTSPQTYYTLTLGTGTYALAGHTTSTNAFTNSGTTTLGAYNLISSGTHTNGGVITLSGAGVIKKAATGGMDETSYISGSANGTGNTITITVTDVTSNLLASSVETKSATLVASTYSDSESVTLTETGVATGIFTGTIPFNIASAASSNSKSDVSGSGSLTLTFTNGYGDLTGTGISATYSGSSVSLGGGTGGGSAPSVSSVTSAATVSAGAETTSQIISLSLSATNAAQVAISEDPGFAGASWETYAPTKSFTLSGGFGVKTVYIKFRSVSGGVTSVYKVNVTLKQGYVAAPIVTAPATSEPVMGTTATTQFELSSPTSKVVISPVKTLVYKPNSIVKYTYSYKNETTKTIKIKTVRQVVDAKGKAVTKVTGSASIAKGKIFKLNTSNTLNSKLADGVYTIKVQVLDFKTGKLIDENSFSVTVKKPVPPPTITTTNPDSKVVITGLKVDYKAGSAVKYTYSYKNNTTKPVSVKIVRQVVGANGKVVNQVDGTRTLSKGASFKFNATSSLGSKLPVGTYTVKVKILDAKNVVLDENGFDFVVKK